MVPGTRLTALAYRWVDPPRHRYGVGLQWRCLVHDNGHVHLLTVSFINPTDAGPEVLVPDAIPVWQYGGTPHAFTFVTASGSDVLDFGECGRIRVMDGCVYPVR